MRCLHLGSSIAQTLKKTNVLLSASPLTSAPPPMTTKIAVYNACVTSTLLSGCVTWTTYTGQERKSNTFHLISIRCILDISQQEKASDAGVLSRAGVPSMYTLPRHHRLRWLGHVRRMEDNRIPKYILYGKLAMGEENHRPRCECCQHRRYILGEPCS